MVDLSHKSERNKYAINILHKYFIIFLTYVSITNTTVILLMTLRRRNNKKNSMGRENERKIAFYEWFWM
jgi:hypothetical protein